MKIPYILFPLALGLGVLVWVEVGEHGHVLDRMLRHDNKQDAQDKRVAEIVAPGPPPKAAIVIDLHNRPDMHIERVSADNDKVIIFYGNYTGHKLCNIKFSLDELSNNQTIVAQAGGYASVYGNGPNDLEAGDHAVVTYDLVIDPKAVKLRVSGKAEINPC